MNGLFSKTAFLVMSLQKPLEPPRYPKTITSFLDWARRWGGYVVWTYLSFSPGYPEISKKNKGMAVWMEKGWFQEVATDHLVNDFTLAIYPTDSFLRTVHYNAFHNSDLEKLLKSWEIEHMVIFGYGAET
jgi:nicotinamidase-related amidase